MPRYTQTELRAAFEMVQDRSHWKNPIDATVPYGANVELIKEAVVHFAGCVPEITRTRRGWRVKAVGYFVAIGA